MPYSISQQCITVWCTCVTLKHFYPHFFFENKTRDIKALQILLWRMGDLGVKKTENHCSILAIDQLEQTAGSSGQKGTGPPTEPGFSQGFFLRSVTDGVLVPCRCRLWLD